MAWTPEQEAAIASRGASLVVSAAAGSGKTSVLVERLIRLLADTEHPTPAEQLVVVTFTNDAAAVVKMRLNRALGEQSEADPENDWLRRQQTMLQSAHISTIHSFCFDLLREQFADANISAGFRIMEETEEQVLRRETIGAVMEEYSKRAAADAETATMQQALLDAFCAGNDSNLDDLILALYECVESTPFGESLLQDAADACQDGRMLRTALAQISAQLQIVKKYQDKALSLMLPICTDKQIAVLTDDIAITDHLRGACEAEDVQQLSAILADMTFGRISLPRKTESAAELGMIRALRAKAKDLLTDLKSMKIPLQFAAEDLPRHAFLMRGLSALVQDFDEALFARKQERCAIGFNDAMRLTLRLLAERTLTGEIVKTPLAQQLSEQYACIMIDEFQDADNQQDLIFRMLSRGGSASHYGENLFVVGDSKQCIYRFRNANPQNFYRAMREGAPYESNELTQNTTIHLNRNFRSAQEVVDFVNAVFTGLMTEAVGEIAYDDTQKLVRGAEYPDAARPVELLLLSGARATAAGEPQAVAERIAWHLRQPTMVKDGDTLRPCRPKDFLILLRASTQMPAYAQALADVGIPVCPTEQGSYLGSQEITLLLEILRAVDNPLLDVSIASAMLSPMFGFSVDNLISVRICDRERGLFQNMQTIAAEADLTDRLHEKCRDFLEFLESMRLFSAMETPEQLIRRIYQQTDFLGLMQMTERGDQKKANLRALTTYARQFEENRGGGLSAFLRYLDAILQRKSDLSAGNTPAVSEDVVMLKTIHKSKGLEAPFVILAQSCNTFSQEDAKKPFQFHSELGFGFKLYDAAALTHGTSLPYQAIAERCRQEALSEELRLLYVALTRARETLILPLVYSDSYAKKVQEYALLQMTFGGQSDDLTASAGSMRDWLMMTLVRNPACEQLRQTLGIELPADDNAPMISVWTDAPQITASDDENEASAKENIPYDAELLARLQAQCAQHYDSPQAHLPAKYGVSEITHGEEFAAPLRRPLFVREQHGLSGAERGTALHLFMQYANFEAAAKNFVAEAERLRKCGRLTERQANAVKRSSMAYFFETPIYAELAAADRVSREEKFTVRLADLQLDGAMAEVGAQYAGTEGMLIGIMDLVYETKDKLVLVDYKTDSAEDGEELVVKYIEQMRLYAGALRLLRGRPVTACYIYSMALRRIVPVPIGTAEP